MRLMQTRVFCLQKQTEVCVTALNRTTKTRLQSKFTKVPKALLKKYCLRVEIINKR